MRWRDFTRMPGMNEKDTHRVLARDYFSDSWLVRFWQYLAYFSNNDYWNNETVLTETTRTELGTWRLWISLLFFFGKMLKVDVYFQLWTGKTRKVQEKVHPRCTFSGLMPGQVAFDFLNFSEASKQQRIKHSQRLKLFTIIRFVP